MKTRTKVILGVILAVISILAVGYVVFYVSAIQGLRSPVLAIVSSPASAKDEVWLLEQGFQDRGISLLIKSPSLNDGKPTRITELDWDGIYSFKQLRWSGDGHLAAFSLQLINDNWSEVIPFAFDFSTREPILPVWQGKNWSSIHTTPSEWKQQEQVILRLAETHGGFTIKLINREDFRHHSRQMLFWQIPGR